MQNYMDHGEQPSLDNCYSSKLGHDQAHLISSSSEAPISSSLTWGTCDLQARVGWMMTGDPTAQAAMHMLEELGTVAPPLE